MTDDAARRASLYGTCGNCGKPRDARPAPPGTGLAFEFYCPECGTAPGRPPLPERERNLIVTTTHLRRHAEKLGRMSDAEDAAGRTMSALIRMIVANEFLALANEVDRGGEPRVSVMSDEERDGDRH